MRGISNINTKRWGVGTLSLIISTFSLMFSFSSLGEKSIGENISVSFIILMMVLSVISSIGK